MISSHLNIYTTERSTQFLKKSSQVPTKNYTAQYGDGRDQKARSGGREKKLAATPEKKLAQRCQRRSSRGARDRISSQRSPEKKVVSVVRWRRSSARPEDEGVAAAAALLAGPETTALGRGRRREATAGSSARRRKKLGQRRTGSRRKTTVRLNTRGDF